MSGRRASCGFVASLLAAAWLAAAATPVGAQALYDFSTRSPGVDAFAYEGESPDQMPPASTVPATPFSPGGVASPGGGSAFYSVGANGRFGHHRFVFVLDEAETAVGRIDLRWDGWSTNFHRPRTDGATLFVWNWTAGVYQAVASSGDVWWGVSLGGALTTNLVDYLGGAGENELVLLVSTNDKRTGNRSLWMASDYVSATVYSRVDRFVIGHDGAGIHCLPEAVSLTAVGPAGNPVLNYTGTVVLDTGTGSGSWLPGPGLGGVLDDGTPGDGLATYTFADADDGVADLLLDYRSGTPSVDVDAAEQGNPAVADDDTEGALVFSPSGFTVTAGPLPNPPPDPIVDPIGPQTAAVPFALHLAAYGQTPTDPTCGVIESYAGSRTLAFWSTPVDPAGQVLPVAVDGIAVGDTEAGAVAIPVGFTSGRASVAVRYDDVGRLRVSMKDTAPAEPVGGIRGASNAFVVRPADLRVLEVTRTDGTPNPGGDTPTGPIFVAAGQGFRAVVRAVDAEGDPTPSYGLEAAPEGIRVEASTLVAPAGGRNGSADDGSVANATAFAPVAPAGTFEATTLAWDEVGAVRLRARVADGSYLGSGDLVGAETGTVGRFVPDHFDVTRDVPVLETACASGGFSYVGQDLRFVPGSEPRLVATARSALATTTANYAGPWMRMAAADLTGLALTDATGTLQPGAPDPPTVADLGGGRVEILFDNGPALRFARGAPVAPFDAEVALRLDVRDADGVVHPGNPVVFGGTAPGSGIAWSAGATQRFGRLQFENAYGSELVDLPVPLSVRYFDGASFLPHTDDACTALAVSDLTLTPTPPGLSTTPSIANSPLAAGDAGLSLSAPGAGNTGYVDLVAGLSALPWLRGDWDGDGVWSDDPPGRATFGVFAGEEALIYVRERY